MEKAQEALQGGGGEVMREAKDEGSEGDKAVMNSKQ